ncbi:hypothetical protein IFT48_01975 [Pseudomonas fluorescens]|uniref:hypothetical protein n=1 Tax=Pseudomonas TaxID=286 RepID=UPI000F019229|nr:MULTISPECIES: hypothetical protein [Pseudomonas]MBD8088730.1 hypothetical protein [Pseudomonas fluorescens]MBD8614809.1 hypothetical protein [Pseudomonas putida]MBD8681507.1 hypothetical protein [Pseudomonas sp. CFBP 13719]
MRFSLPPLTLEDLASVTFSDLDSFMIEQRWRTQRNYDQRRITPRQDKGKVDIKGWRVSHEKGTGDNRERIQQSFYFTTYNGFSAATAEAQSYRDNLERENGLVAWRLKPVENLENAFCVAGITLQTGKGRSPFWLYRQGDVRVTSSIASHGLRGAYFEVARTIAPVDDDAPLPLLTAEEAEPLISTGLLTQEALEAEELATRMWVRNYLLSIRSKPRKAA